jgi:hypothetical protein
VGKINTKPLVASLRQRKDTLVEVKKAFLFGFMPFITNRNGLSDYSYIRA